MNRRDNSPLSALAARHPVAPALLPSAPLMRMLAATRASGVLLLSGDGLYPLAPFLLEGVDMGGRLIVNVEDEALSAALQPLLAPDIRCTVHCQQRTAFLEDIHQHHFDLVLLQYRDPTLTATAAARLAPCGVLGFYEAPTPPTLATALAPERWHLASPGDPSVVLASRAHDGSDGAGVRRGGRRRRT